MRQYIMIPQDQFDACLNLPHVHENCLNSQCWRYFHAYSAMRGNDRHRTYAQIIDEHPCIFQLFGWAFGSSKSWDNFCNSWAGPSIRIYFLTQRPIPTGFGFIGLKQQRWIFTCLTGLFKTKFNASLFWPGVEGWALTSNLAILGKQYLHQLYPLSD